MKKIIYSLCFSVLLLGCASKMQSVAQNSDPVDLQKIKIFLNTQEKKGMLHGAILIADKENILFKNAYGYKDLELKHKHNLNSKIGLASLPKMFTAIAIMQLQSQGEIDINVPISTYLPNDTNESWSNLTTKHLLSHTGGLGFYWDYEEYDDSNSYSINDLYSLINKNDIEPLELGVFNYSNNGYIVLGKIIENITNQTYEHYIDKNIIKPLKMENTVIGLPDGNAFKSTLNDLFMVSKALIQNKLLKKEVLNKMVTKQSLENYGLGFKLAFIGQSKIYGHPGGSFEDDKGRGVAAGLDIVDDKYTVIVLTNRNPRMGGAKIRQYLLNELSVKE